MKKNFKNYIEWHYFEHNGIEDVLIYPSIHQVCMFNRLFSHDVYDDNGIKCIMRDGYFCFWMNTICEYYDIELSEIFPKEK